MPIGELLDELLTSLETGPHITAVRRFERRPAVFAPFPSSLDPRLVESLRSRGVQQLYSHQARAFEIVAKGENLVVVTPTASG
jgi:DEAD/DEAH box helicase domain-containing protein